MVTHERVMIIRPVTSDGDIGGGARALSGVRGLAGDRSVIPEFRSRNSRRCLVITRLRTDAFWFRSTRIAWRDALPCAGLIRTRAR